MVAFLTVHLFTVLNSGMASVGFFWLIICLFIFYFLSVSLLSVCITVYIIQVNGFCCVSADGPHVLLLHPAGVCGQLWCRLPCQHVSSGTGQLEHSGQRPLLPLLPDVRRAVSGELERWVYRLGQETAYS